MSQNIELEKNAPCFSVRLTAVEMGNDLNISIYGGDAPHIGAVALAVPHPGLSDSEKVDASVSLIAVTGHKEDELARKAAYRIATAGNCTVAVSCGIHIDDATADDIAEVLRLADELVEEFVGE